MNKFLSERINKTWKVSKLTYLRVFYKDISNKHEVITGSSWCAQVHIIIHSCFHRLPAHGIIKSF